MPRAITKRTPERLIRAAYDFEHLAGYLRSGGFDSHANSVQSIAQTLGNVGRDLRELLDERRNRKRKEA